MKNTIYVSYNKRCDLIKTAIFKPIQVGAKINGPYYENALNDSINENISDKNQSFCELTAQYWAWKNDHDSDYIGFYHYRRHLILNDDNHEQENQFGLIEYEKIDNAYLTQSGYNDEAVNDYLKDADLVIPEKWDVRKHYAKNNLDQYKRGSDLHVDDYYSCLSILEKKYPEYKQAISTYNTSCFGYYTNMFIMKREVFNSYSSWLFDILFELEGELDIMNYSLQEYRVFGYLSEWLFGIYITEIKQHKKYKIKTARRSFINNTDTGKYRIYKENNWIKVLDLKINFDDYDRVIPVITAFNENYAIAGAALIQSIIENSSATYFYDLYIIEGSLSDETKLSFNLMLKNKNNFRLNIIDADYFFKGKQLGLCAHFSKEIYYRLLIPRLLPNYDKVIYLDADTVVNKDISQLYTLDLSGKAIAAVKDCVMAGFIKYGTLCRKECGHLTAREYLTKYLGMKDVRNYIQSGVLVIDCAYIRKNQIDDKIIAEIPKKMYWFPDQDLINKFFEGNVKFLDIRWNVFHGNGDVDGFFRKLPLKIMSQYFEARKDPWIIHFAGEKKPWIFTNIDYSNIFRFYLRNTPLQWSNHTNCDRNQAVSILQLLKPFIKNLLPIGTRRRRLAVKIYTFASNLYNQTITPT